MSMGQTGNTDLVTLPNHRRLKAKMTRKLNDSYSNSTLNQGPNFPILREAV